MIKAIIIDDEPDARENLSYMINAYSKNVNVAALAEGVETGFNMIQKHQPDIVFLDIKMPDGSGFDLLNKFDHINFKVIFITAYEQYAIKAFKFSALDYLLKPVDPDDLIAAIDQATNSLEHENMALKMEAFLENTRSNMGKEKKLILRTAESIYVKSTADIISFQSDGSYTQINLPEGKKIIVSKALKEFDELLNGHGFLRTHKSHLINIDHIDRFHKGDGGYIVMKDGSTIPVSQRKRENLFKILNDF